MKRFCRSIGSVVASFMMAVLAVSCSTPESSAPVPLPPSAPRIIAEKPADRDHAQLVAAFGGELRAPLAQHMLDGIVARLVAASDQPQAAFQVTILNSPVVNAFSLPDNHLYITRGLLVLANDTAEIAAVLSHELAHITLHHASQRSEMQARSTLIRRVTQDVLKRTEDTADLQDLSRRTLAGFSRAQEFEADQVGVKVLAGAGFDPYGAPRFLTLLGRQAGADTKQGGLADMMATHPSTTERIARALSAAAKAGGIGRGEADRLSYLAAIDHLPYGDDPADGIVRGRHFIHARLGVAFDAPEGFSLENTSQAVLGSSGEGSQRLLFDAAETQEGQSLEEVLRSTWNDTIEPGSLETTTVNGFPTALALSRGKEWNFRLSALQIGPTTYRMIVAVKVGSGDLDKLFHDALMSIRKITPEEAQTIQPLHLMIVTAMSDDTAETMAARMSGVGNSLERFLILNELDRSAPLKEGEHYKIVAE